MSRVAIRCEHLCKRFGSVRAACGVNLEVRESRFLALLGPSGCGKTTVLRLLAGLESPDRGEIEIGGRMANTQGHHVPPEQRKIGMVFQEYALFPHMNVAENVGYGLPRNGSRDERVHQMLELVGLADVKLRMTYELSGGQQQRVALARALAPRPDLILLDEPFSNLDAALRVRVRFEVRHILKQAGVTAIFVTHDQEEALSIADEIAVMMDGRIIQTGTPQEVYRHPVAREVATFLGDANFLIGRMQGPRARCELGDLEVMGTHDGDVEIMFRPEDLLLTRHAAGSARITEIEFFGHDQLIELRLDSGTILRSRLLGANGGFQPGERVNVTIHSPVVVYPRA